MKLIRDLLEAMKKDEWIDSQDVLSKIKSAEKNKDIEKDCVGFILEEIDKKTKEKRYVKVFIAKDQAKAFESTLATALEEYKGKKEIAEILFTLREKFNIVNVEWSVIPEDEEVNQELPGEGGDTLDITKTDGDSEASLEITKDNTEEGTRTALQSFIDMLKADAEAKKAEAEAKKAEAEAETAKLAAQAAMAKVHAEEEILDMETYYKEKEEKKKEAEKLAKLAKYKHDRAQELERELDKEEPEVEKEISVKKLTVTEPTEEPSEQEFAQYSPEDEEVDVNEDGYIDDEEYLKYVDKYLRRSVQAQE